MKIWIVSRSIPAHGAGGMESVAWDLSHALAHAGADVTIVTTAHQDLPEHGHIDPIKVRTLSAPPGRYSHAWWRASGDEFLSGGHDVDVILSVSAAANAMVRRRSSHPRARFAFQAHGTSSGEIVSKLRSRSAKAWVGATRNLYWGVTQDWIYRRYDAVIAVGDAVKRQLAEPPTRWLVGDTPAAFIPNGVAPQTFAFDASARERVRARFDISRDARVQMSICRLHAQKGLHQGLNAFALASLEDSDLRYLIVGSGPEEAALRQRIGKMGLEGKAILLGSAVRADIPALLSAADGFLFPTLRVEGLPITVLEALASGLPVITSHSGADPGLPCARVDPHDQRALAEAIQRTPAGFAERESLLPDEYTIAHSAKVYLDLFQQMTGGRSAPQ